VNTAIKEDGIIRENPCRVKGYDRYHTPERPVPTVAQVYALAGAVSARFSALILVAAFSGLRWGELAPVRRGSDSWDGEGSRKLAALRDRLQFGPPKSDAGNRTVALPAAALAALRPHMLTHVKADQVALVFTGGKGKPLRTSNFRRAVKWAQVLKAASMPEGFTFMISGTPGNSLAASSGASTGS
jgi:integrase